MMLEIINALNISHLDLPSRLRNLRIIYFVGIKIKSNRETFCRRELKSATEEAWNPGGPIAKQKTSSSWPYVN